MPTFKPNFKPDFAKGLATQANRQTERPEAVDDDYRRPAIGPAYFSFGKEKPRVNPDNRPSFVRFAAPPPIVPPLPPQRLKIVNGRIKRTAKQQADHDGQKLPVRKKRTIL